MLAEQCVKESTTAFRPAQDFQEAGPPEGVPVRVSTREYLASIYLT